MRSGAEDHFDKDKCFVKYVELYETLTITLTITIVDKIVISCVLKTTNWQFGRYYGIGSEFAQMLL